MDIRPAKVQPRCHSCLKKINNPQKKGNWWGTILLVVRGQRVDINLSSTSAEVENYCHSCLKKYKNPKKGEKVWPTTRVKGGRKEEEKRR